jgi:hypothetical protein
VGIRFQCHHCDFELHVKDFQAGRRGRCPECQGRFRVPQQSANYSLALDGETNPHALATAVVAKTASHASSPVAAVESLRQLDGVENAETPVVSQTSDTPSNLASPAPQGTMLSPMVPRAIADAAAGIWYVRPTSGGQFGPAESPTFVQWLQEGRISRDALVWRDGWPEWLSGAQAFPDYFGPSLPVPNSTGNAAALGVTPPSGEPGTPQTSPAVTATPSLGARNRLGRKQQKRRRYIMMLSILTVLFIGLITALVVVITMQGAA